MSTFNAWWPALPVLLAMGAATWLISLTLRNASIADSVWSLSIGAAGATYALMTPTMTLRAVLVLALLTVWALRLAIYITVRNRGHGEDRRYQAIRARNQPHFGFRSLWLVFGLQALLAWIVSLPVLAAMLDARRLQWQDAGCLFVACAGLLWESVGDAQLARFKADQRNRAKVMSRGLWRYSRHPNYFGEWCVWWGLGLVALCGGAWWALASPLLMTVLLLRVSGVPLLEGDIGERRPGYGHYVANTNAFFPWRPRVRRAERNT